MVRGKLITFEGVEGCGKSTQSRRLVEALRDRGLDVVHAREPGGTPTAEAIRAILLDPAHAGMPAEVELLLYAAARADHVRRAIEPALAAGRHVVCDRFSDSTRAYQGAARGLDPAVVERTDEVARGGLVPDATVLLDLPAEAGLQRARDRNAGPRSGPDESRLEDEDIAFHRRVRSGFLRLAKEAPTRIWVVDATGDVDDVARRVAAVVARVIPEAGS